MIVIIDGYNLLRSMFHKVKGRLDKQRKELIKNLGIYKSKRGNDVTIVFDGGLSKHATRNVRGGVVVVFSGQARSADEWIIDYIERNADKEMMLVTNDREIKSRTRRFNVDFLDVEFFEEFLESVLFEEVLTPEGLSPISDELEGDELAQEALEILMEQSGLDYSHKDDDYPSKNDRRGNPQKASKYERRLSRKIEKL